MKSTVSRSALRQKPKRESTLKVLKTPSSNKTPNRPKVLSTVEHPEADVKNIVRGLVRRGLKPLASKSSISLRVDADVLAWFKAQGDGYQTRINSVLRAFRDASV
jgi:uncharacterized protein (DUF4415 family)